jgi:Lar family restriction alleviation protein
MNEETNKLKPDPCPFCGSSNLETGEVWDVPGGYVRCQCGAIMQCKEESESHAVNKWNKRAAIFGVEKALAQGKMAGVRNMERKNPYDPNDLYFWEWESGYVIGSYIRKTPPTE